MYLNPTGVLKIGSSYRRATRSIRWVVATERATPPRQPLDPDEIVEEKGQDHVLDDEVALLVQDAEAVPVGVRGQADVALALPDELAELPQVGLGAGGRDAAEIGVDVAVDLLDRDPVFLQDLVQVFAARPVKRVDRDPEAGLLDGREIDLLPDELQVILLEVDLLE